MEYYYEKVNKLIYQDESGKLYPVFLEKEIQLYFCKNCRKLYLNQKEEGKYCYNCMYEKLKDEAEEVRFYTNQTVVCYKNEWFYSIDDVEEFFNSLSKEELEELDPRLWVCEEKRWKGIDPRRFIEESFTGDFQGFEFFVKDSDKLEKAIKEWCELQYFIAYTPTFKEYVNFSDLKQKILNEKQE